jgi:hypothetical protein
MGSKTSGSSYTLRIFGGESPLLLYAPTVALVLPELPHHITQRGNYRQRTYFRAEDYRLYLELLKDYSRHHGVTLLGYCYTT